jgi:hypothetical protein
MLSSRLRKYIAGRQLRKWSGRAAELAATSGRVRAAHRLLSCRRLFASFSPWKESWIKARASKRSSAESQVDVGLVRAELNAALARCDEQRQQLASEQSERENEASLREGEQRAVAELQQQVAEWAGKVNILTAVGDKLADDLRTEKDARAESELRAVELLKDRDTERDTEQKLVEMERESAGRELREAVVRTGAIEAQLARAETAEGEGRAAEAALLADLKREREGRLAALEKAQEDHSAAQALQIQLEDAAEQIHRLEKVEDQLMADI